MVVGTRTLRLVVQTAKGALPLVVAATIVEAGGCGNSTDVAGRTLSEGGNGQTGTGGILSAGGAAHAGSSAGGVVGSGGGIIFIGSGGEGSGGLGPGQCDFMVELPPAGVPAQPGQICSATMVPVDSNRAALVTFTGQYSAPTGSIAIAPALKGLVVGTPTVDVIDATDPTLLKLAFENVRPSVDGFTFTTRATGATNFNVDGMTRITVRVSLEITCDGTVTAADAAQATQVVHAVTDVHLCGDGRQAPEWVSSGSVCTVCRIIAEMAPSPIVPDKAADELPLGRVLRARIIELARISNTVVLLAENDGGEGLEYEWHVSAGRVERLAPDVIAWTLAEGMAAPYAQAAIWNADAAAVASFAFNTEAA
jgi:hypothetical protein